MTVVVSSTCVSIACVDFCVVSKVLCVWQSAVLTVVMWAIGGADQV